MKLFSVRRPVVLAAITILALVLSACGNQHVTSGPTTSKATVVTGGVVRSIKPSWPAQITFPKEPKERPRAVTTTTRPKAMTTTTTMPPPTTTVVRRPPPGPCTTGFVCGHVTAIGDSVMIDAEPDLQFDIPGIDVEAVVSRQWDDGILLAQQMKEDGTLGSIVVIDLGTNGPVDLEQFQQMMSVLTGASVVVFVTIHLPSYYSWSQSVNATLEQGVPMYHDTRLADFNALADANPEWFGPDGVHMPIGGTGAQAMARLIASLI